MGAYLKLSQRMEKLLKDSDTLDIHFLFDEEDGKVKRLAAHRNILSSASPVFKAMFFGPLAEKDEVTIVDVTHKSFDCMLKFIYTDEAKLEPDVAGSVLYLAKKYDIPGLADHCKSYIKTSMDRENVVSILQGLMFAADEELNEVCLKLMDRNGHFIINSNHVVEKMNWDILKMIITRDTFCAREIDILDAIQWWIKKQPGNENLTHNEVRDLMDEIIPLIRFPTMTMKEFVQLVVPTKILRNDEVLDILATYRRAKNVVPHTCRFPSIRRCLNEVVKLNVKDVPPVSGVPVEFSMQRLECINKLGLRVMKFKLNRRLFLTKVIVGNVPNRISVDGYVTSLLVQDVDLSEIVSRNDFCLKRGDLTPPRPGRYELDIKEPVELCPKVNYELRITIDNPGHPKMDMVRKQGEFQEFIFYLERYGRIWDEEVQIEEIHFLF